MKERVSPLFILVAIITAIAALYIAKEILLPIAMAILLTFLLTPLTDRLERFRIPRIPAVLLVVTFAFAILGGLTWVVANQLIDLTTQLPAHEKNLIDKIESIRPNSPTFARVGKTLTDLRDVLTNGSGKKQQPNDLKSKENDNSQPPSSAPPDSASNANESRDRSAATKAIESLATAAIEPDAATAAPVDNTVAVKVVEMPPSPLQQLQGWLGPLVAPLTGAGMVVILVLFLLLDRESQRARFIQLFGRSHLHATTEAVHDVASRVGRYLRALFLINAGYGAAVGIGLWFIGVPGAVMWGTLGFALRFLPYIGPWIAATLPIFVSVATSTGWTQPLLVIGWYLFVELISNNVVEPLAYGNTTGVSTVGVIIAAIFWTWLWGPIGLILSVPMTVSLLVAARYVPQLRFITVLFADQPPLTPAERVYQRLLAFDYNEPRKLAERHLKENSLAAFYDDILIPALVLAEQDRHSGLLNDEQAEFVSESAEDLVAELDETARNTAAAGPITDDRNANETIVANLPSARVLCIPLRDEADELASRMLVQLLKDAGFHAEAGAAKSLTSELVDQVADSDSDIVVISVLPPIAPRDSRLLWRRLRVRYPHLPIVIGFWTATNEKQSLAEPVADASSRVVTTLADAVTAVRATALHTTPVAKTA